MADFGRIVLQVAIFFTSFAIIVDILAAWKKKPILAACGFYATIGIFACLTLAIMTLWVLLFKDDFSVDYVALHSSGSLPALYKLSALWSGSGGALLLWLWLQVGFVCIALPKSWPNDITFLSRGRSLTNFVCAFCLRVLLHEERPFSTSAVAVTEAGSNESLMNMSMALYPLLMLIGYAALIIPFAWAFGFFKSDPNIHVTTFLSKARSWTLFAWFFLTVSIVAGVCGISGESGAGDARGWGSAVKMSLIPWFFVTVMFFCYRAYYSRAFLGVLTAIMSVLAYSFCVYVAFLTEYGLDVSAGDSHDGGAGKYFVVLLIHICAIAGIMLFRRHFRKDKMLVKKDNKD